MKTLSFNVYTYDELSSEAKEKAKENYLSLTSTQEDIARDLAFEWDDQLHDEFPISSLNVQFSFGCCQGDGVNVFGKLSLKDIFDFDSYEIKDGFKCNLANFTKEEIQEIEANLSDCFIELKYNPRYTYCRVAQSDISGQCIDMSDTDRIWALDNFDQLKNVYDRLEALIVDHFESMCSDWQYEGDSAYAEVSDEEILCAYDDDAVFNKDGSFFYANAI